MKRLALLAFSLVFGAGSVLAQGSCNAAGTYNIKYAKAKDASGVAGLDGRSAKLTITDPLVQAGFTLDDPPTSATGLLDQSTCGIASAVGKTTVSSNGLNFQLDATFSNVTFTTDISNNTVYVTGLFTLTSGSITDPYNILGSRSLTALILPTLGNSPVHYTGEPVSTATGELFDDFPPDLSLGGALPVVFRRYYGSFLKPNGVSSALGNNWMHDFDWKLSINGAAATVTMFRGKTVVLNQPASGNVWLPANPELFAYQLVTSASGGYRFFDPQSRLIYDFSSTGALNKIEDENGNALAITQSPAGPTDVSDGLGRTLHFTYTGNQLTKVQDQSGRAVNFTYSGSDLIQTQDANGNTTTYAYAIAGTTSSLITAATLPAGNKPFTQTFNSQGQVSQQTDSRGNSYALAFGGSNTATITDPIGRTTQDVSPGYTKITKFTDANGSAVNMTYDAANHRTGMTDRLGNTTSLAYDNGSGYLASLTDAMGDVFSSSYTQQSRQGFQVSDVTATAYPDATSLAMSRDANGNLTKLTDQAAKNWTYTYDNHGQVLTAANPSGGVTQYSYNTDETLASVQRPSGDIYKLTYDAAKRPTQVALPDGSSQSYQYDNVDNLTKLTDERGKTVQFGFNSNNDLVTLTDAMNQSVTLAYDGNERLSQLTNRLGKTRKYQYNELGLLKSLTNEAGEIYTWTYDKLNRISSILDPAGKGASFTFNAEGVPASATDAVGRTTTYSSDPLGRITGIQTPLGESFAFSYDAMSRLKQATDPVGRATGYAYDPRGLPASISQPAGISASFAYNELGRLTSTTDPNGNTWKRTFDTSGRITSRVDPLARTTSFTYGLRSRLSGFTTPVGTGTYSYDTAGNLIKRTYSDGTTVNYTVDDNNRIVSATGITLAYDAEERITSSNGISVARDPVGRISAVTYGSGKTVNYAYDSRGLLAQISDWKGGTTSLTYNDARQLVSLTRPNGVVTSYTYDQDGRLANITETASGSQLASIALHRDKAGQITSADRNLPQQANPAPGTSSLGFDAADQVSQYTYDGMGRRTKDSTRSYTWDMASNLTGYSGADGSATFSYDAFGFRTSAASGGSTRNYVLNYAMLLPALSTVQAGSSDLRYYVYFPNGMLLYSVEAADNSRRFYHFDEMGSTTGLTDDSGKVVASYGITPYGETVSQTGNADNPFTFLGAYGVMQEGSTGLYYIRRRYYDSAAASFLSPDPVRSRVPKRINPYQYSRANPLVYRDVTGLDEGWDYGFIQYPNGTGNWHESPDGTVTGVYTPKRRKKKDPINAIAAAAQPAGGAGAGAAGGPAPEAPGASGGTQDWNEILKGLPRQAHPPMGSETQDWNQILKGLPRQAHPPMSLPSSLPQTSRVGSGPAVIDTDAFYKFLDQYNKLLVHFGTLSSSSNSAPSEAPYMSRDPDALESESEGNFYFDFLTLEWVDMTTGEPLKLEPLNRSFLPDEDEPKGDPVPRKWKPIG